MAVNWLGHGEGVLFAPPMSFSMTSQFLGMDAKNASFVGSTGIETRCTK